MLYIYKFKYDSFYKKISYKSYTISENIKETPKLYSLTGSDRFPNYSKNIKKSDLNTLRDSCSEYSMVSEQPNEDLFKQLLIKKLNSSKAGLENKLSELDSQLEYVNKL